MTHDEITQKFHQLLRDTITIGDAVAITPETLLIEDLAADSLDLIELVLAVEESFDVDVPDDAAENIRTVGECVAGISGLLAPSTVQAATNP